MLLRAGTLCAVESLAAARDGREAVYIGAGAAAETMAAVVTASGRRSSARRQPARGGARPRSASETTPTVDARPLPPMCGAFCRSVSSAAVGRRRAEKPRINSCPFCACENAGEINSVCSLYKAIESNI